MICDRVILELFAICELIEYKFSTANKSDNEYE